MNITLGLISDLSLGWGIALLITLLIARIIRRRLAACAVKVGHVPRGNEKRKLVKGRG